ncbi:SWI/SNF- matrix-associated actin-dependent regulator of chromatin sub A-like protein 1 [Bulinus truncatus]|nr:SWI/SNF- matrix-associated actin-dependent regulator of chromatin sub A-like protein 1 [Bulinus truncatus]
MSFHGLTEEQKRRIEENKKRALSKLAEKHSPVKQSVTHPLPKIDNVVSFKVVSTKPSGIKVAAPASSDLPGLNTKVSNYSDLQNIQSHFSNGDSFKKCTPAPQNFKTVTVNSGVWTSKSTAIAEKNSIVSKETIVGLHKTQIKGKCVLIDCASFSVEIGYNAAIIEYFKHFKTRRYDSVNKIWSFQLEDYDQFIKGLNSLKPDIEIDALPSWILKTFKPGGNKTDTEVVADLKNVDKELVETLMPFQRLSVNFAIHQNGRILIADDMGLGKTLQALCIAAYYKSEWPLLVVSPSSVRFDWSQQIKKWLPSVVDINVVETGKDSAVSGLVNIISYDLLSKKDKELKKQSFKVIIMDESHFLKSPKAVRTKSALPLLKTANRVILLSGTPALSRPSELFSQIIAVCPNVFNFHDYGVRYCNAKQMPWGWDYSGSSNMQELQLFLEKKIMIRRMKKDVLSQLPSKTRHLVFLNIKKCKSLSNVSKIMSNNHLKSQDRREMLLQYFHETCRVKLDSVRQYILDLIESDKKFLIYAHHTEMMDSIEECISKKTPGLKYIRIDGRTPSEQRNYFCKKFQTDSSYRVAVLSITAANAGLNLCAASLVVFAELFWNPGVLVQAEDRVHRIGQEDSVCVQYLVAKGTADDYIWPLVQDKLNILSKVGLAKDDFSHADKSFVTNDSQMTILNMFKSDFINESSEEISNSETLPVEEMTASPKINIKQSEGPSHSQKKSPFKSQVKEVTPVKRQASLFSFFERTPPKKIARLELTEGQTEKDVDTSSQKSDSSSQKSSVEVNNDDIDSTEYCNELSLLETVDWEEEF